MVSILKIWVYTVNTNIVSVTFTEDPITIEH